MGLSVETLSGCETTTSETATSGQPAGRVRKQLLFFLRMRAIAQKRPRAAGTIGVLLEVPRSSGY